MRTTARPLRQTAYYPWHVWVDRWLAALLLLMLVAMPLAFGVVQPLTEQLFVASSGAALLLYLARSVLAGDPVVPAPALYAVAAFLALALLQLAPLPAPIAHLLSPNTALLRAHYLGDLPPGSVDLDRFPLSFDRHAGIAQLGLVASVASFFVVACKVFSTTRRARAVLVTMSVVGALLACVAVVQMFFGNGRILWVGPPAWQRTAGTFVCHSHHSQFLTLCFGCALALAASPRGQTSPFLRALAGTCAALLAAGVLLSYSRAGALALLLSLAAAVACRLVATRRVTLDRRWLIGAALALAAVIVLDGLMGWSILAARVASLATPAAYSDRILILRSLTHLWPMFPVFGTGLGTFQWVFQPFELGFNPNVASHAENEYAHVMTEMGVAGLLCVAGFAHLVVRRARQRISAARIPNGLAPLGLWVALAAVALHSASDFGQHLPAIACMSATLLALLHGPALGPRCRAGQPDLLAAPLRWRSPHRLLLAAATLAAALAFTLALAHANRARQASDLAAEADALSRAGVAASLSPSRRADLAASLSASAVILTPDDPALRVAYVRHTWNALATRLAAREIDDADFRRQTESLDQVLTHTRNRAPFYGPAALTQGSLACDVLEIPRGRDALRRAAELMPLDSTALLDAARIDLAENHPAQALSRLTRVLQVTPHRRPECIALLNQSGHPDLAATLP